MEETNQVRSWTNDEVIADLKSLQEMELRMGNPAEQLDDLQSEKQDLIYSLLANVSNELLYELTHLDALIINIDKAKRYLENKH